MRPFPILIALAMVAAACGDTASQTSSTTPGSTTPATEPSTTLAATTTRPPTTSPSTTAATTTTTTVPLPDPVEGWGRLDTDADAFGDVTVTDGTAAGGRFVLAGCEGFDAARGDFPIWWADSLTTWQRAEGPGGVGCVDQVEATPFGYFAAGLGVQGALHSTDGEVWTELELAGELGLEHTGQLGPLFAIFVSPSDDRVTLLFSAAAEAESRIATLMTTTDGETWAEGPADSADLFDSSDISAVIEGGPGLIAVGASPGGEFVPSAAVFTSVDGLVWTRRTPRNDDFNDKVMNDVRPEGTGYVAVGGDFFVTGLMTAWTSPDGIEWIQSPHPPEETDPAVAQMTAEAVTRAGGLLWAAGRDFDARRDDNGLPAMWSSEDGVAWTRVDLEEVRGTIPFAVIDTPDLRIGVWPPPYSLSGDPVQLFASD